MEYYVMSQLYNVHTRLNIAISSNIYRLTSYWKGQKLKACHCDLEQKKSSHFPNFYLTKIAFKHSYLIQNTDIDVDTDLSDFHENSYKQTPQAKPKTNMS